MGVQRRDRGCDVALAHRIQDGAALAERGQGVVGEDQRLLEPNEADFEAVDAVDLGDDLVAETRRSRRVVEAPVGRAGRRSSTRGGDAARGLRDDVARCARSSAVVLRLGGFRAARLRNCDRSPRARSCRRSWKAVADELGIDVGTICSPRCGIGDDEAVGLEPGDHLADGGQRQPGELQRARAGRRIGPAACALARAAARWKRS